MLDNPDDGTEDDDAGLEQKLRAEAERMTTANAERPPARTEDQTDDEPEEQENTEQPPAAQQVQQEQARHRVKVRGEEFEVPLDELINGYQRQEDYSRDKSALKDERQRVITEGRSQYEQLNNQLISRLQAFMPEKPDVAMLNPNSEKYNPDAYHLGRANYEAFQDHLGAAQNEQKRLQGERDAEAKQAATTRMQEESAKILKAIPEWKDDKVFQEDIGKMRSFLKTENLSEDDINAWVNSPGFNHVQVKILRLAVQAHAAKDQKAIAEAKVKDVPPVMKPGAAEVKDTDSDEVRRLRAAVKKNPRDDRLLAQLMTAEDKQDRTRANRR